MMLSLPSISKFRRFHILITLQKSFKPSKPNAFKKSCSRSYSNRTDADSRLDITRPDYGLTDVCLDSEKYYSAFSNSKAFLRANDEPWMLWQPPKSIVKTDEWYEVLQLRSIENSKRSLTSRLEALWHRLLFPLQHFENPENAIRFFIHMVSSVNDGDLESTKPLLHPSCYNYIKGWLEYMKDNGYTCNHTIESIENPFILGSAILVLGDQSVPRYIETPGAGHYIYGSGIPQNVSGTILTRFVTREKYDIFDSEGKIVHSSPSRVCEHIWKMGAQSIYTRESGYSSPMFLLHDINNQVSMRAHDLLTKEKLFLSSDAPKEQVWMMTL